MIKIISSITIVVAMLTALIVFWGSYGWITQDAYAADHESVPTQQTMAAIATSLKNIEEAQVENQDQWECDEMDEEIPELQSRLLEAETSQEQIRLQRKLTKQEERWGKLACSRFTE
jgi:hypothetical protein